MSARSLAIVVLSLLAGAGCAGMNAPACPEAPPPPPHLAGSATPAATPPPPRIPPEQRHVYRVEVTIAVNDPGKPPTTSTHVLHVDEEHNSEVRMGTNVPLTTPGSTGPGPRQDVGFNIRVSPTTLGDDVLMAMHVEMSGVEEGGVIRKVSAMDAVLLTPGKPTVVTTMEDPTSHKRFQVTATATRLR